MISRNIFRLLILCLMVPTAISAEAVFLKLGYGGIWQLYEEPLPASTPLSSGASASTGQKANAVGLGDRFALGFDLKLTKQHAFSGAFETDLAFTHRSLSLGGLAYKWFPFDWYNTPFVGAGIDYFGISLGTANVVDRFGLHLAYGLNIQFPENIYLIVDFKNVFFDAVSNQVGTERYTHFLILTASFAYRIPVGD
ncbi:MAG: hypothetical protein ACOY5B_17760 [Spirochaetota bacterium]